MPGIAFPSWLRPKNDSSRSSAYEVLFGAGMKWRREASMSIDSATDASLSVPRNGAACTNMVNPACCIGLFRTAVSSGDGEITPFAFAAAAAFARAAASFGFSCGALPRGAA